MDPSQCTPDAGTELDRDVLSDGVNRVVATGTILLIQQTRELCRVPHWQTLRTERSRTSSDGPSRGAVVDCVMVMAADD